MKKTTQNLIKKPPVAVILGHVDSGKTSILDFIRKSHIAEKESGGITQHIGAYQIEHKGKKITFIDTPGHEAFSQMRSRGAKVADIAVLVVDSCKGVELQTKEAIYHIKLAEVPLIVALNKTDRPEANPEKVKKELIKEDIQVESLGGKIPSVNVSARTGQGVDEILELILLIGEMENLKMEVSVPAEGVVIESYLNHQRGPVATLIPDKGTLRVGDIIGTFSSFGKIKSLENFRGISVEQALPSDPVSIVGLEGAVRVGEDFKVFPSVEEAKNNLKAEKKIDNSTVLDVEPGQRVLNVILKADFLGSMEAIDEVLKEIPQEKILLRILKSEVGDINESDIKTARSGKAVILGFRVKTDAVARQMAEREKIRIISVDVIYNLVEEVRNSMERIMAKESVRTDLGKVKILGIFLTDKNRQIVGGKVIEGEVKKGASIEVVSQENLVGKGRMINLQRDKKDIDKVAKGQECGIMYEGDTKVEVGDVLVIYTEEKVKGEL
ncbi:MAG: translation initiation factor IF-2 [Candidatus Paceibacterota bacterium]